MTETIQDIQKDLDAALEAGKGYRLNFKQVARLLIFLERLPREQIPTHVQEPTPAEITNV